MDSLGFPTNWVWRPILALLGFAIAFYVGAYLILKFWDADLAMARARPSNSDASAGKEKMVARSRDEVRTVTIRLDGYALDLEKRSLKRKTTKTILNPLTTEFHPGTLNVIMGPSGSGKTTLLNTMAGRLRDDLTTRYKKSGNMTFNGLAPSEDVVHAICSFVTQDDDALLASLTVRETLRYAAGLRLPKWMKKQEKMQRAEDILLKMGLKDCADNLIGNDLIKGISGGEKRRVTIAVQILTEPRILLLDEPLSGLDAFTALSIMDVLRGLANEGRTLIVTIHQPRSDLFAHFGNLLLLARGGYPVYAGPAQGMLPHFAKQGYECPRHINPADFALDLITVDLQHESREAASRAKVRSLIDSWSPDMFPVTRTGSITTPAELGSMARAPASFSNAFSILLRRATKNFFRQPDLLAARIGQVAGLAIVLALFFAPLKNNYFAVQNRLGFLVEIAPLYFVGSTYHPRLTPPLPDPPKLTLPNSAQQHRRLPPRARRLLPRLRRPRLQRRGLFPHLHRPRSPLRDPQLHPLLHPRRARMRPRARRGDLLHHHVQRLLHRQLRRIARHNVQHAVHPHRLQRELHERAAKRSSDHG